MSQVNIHQAKTHLSRLVEQAASGKEIIIAKAGRPIARLVPYVGKGKPRRPGQLRGKVRIKKSFDQPLPKDILASFQGRP
ncbi:MAG: type II toxin-antitoxin system Phd/YefM family antitoxin [Candidatus Binatia bacterium]